MEADIVVIGGNPSGCCAAISAARSGKKVILLEPTKTLGGINSNGVFGFDSASPQALSGIAQEVEARVKAYYRAIGLDDPLFVRRADQVWESHVIARIWHELVDETEGLTVLTKAVPVNAITVDGKITEVHWQPAVDFVGNIEPDRTDHEVVTGQMFIDASYEGDILEWADVPYTIGREARSPLEPHAGRIYTNNIDFSPDGWMPHSVLPGSTGEASDAIMAFACRLHCKIYEDTSPEAAHRIKSPPTGYDPANYAWLPVDRQPNGTPIYFNSLYVLVNDKYLVNRMTRGNNLVAPARDYILAHPRDRKELRQRFYDHALGYLYYIQTEGGSPDVGLADDEFTDHSNLPYQLYIRGCRRIEGHVTLTEADISPYIMGDNFRPPRKRDAISIGDWMPESHGCSDVIEQGQLYPEGWFLDRAARAPYQIPYPALLPKKINNLLVSGGISATHVAFSAIRCEAARIHMGIAAGVAAAMALDMGCDPADLPVDVLQEELLRRKVKLTWFADVDGLHPDFMGIQWAALRSFLPQDEEWRFFPDHPVNWADFVKAIVLCLDLPISVSGAHFENVGQRDPMFRYLESLYDFGTRAGVDLFHSKNLKGEDPLRALLRFTLGPRLLPFTANAPVSCGQAAAFLADVAAAIGKEGPPVPDNADSMLKRGQLCTALKQICSA